MAQSSAYYLSERDLATGDALHHLLGRVAMEDQNEPILSTGTDTICRPFSLGLHLFPYTFPGFGECDGKRSTR